MSPRLDNEIRLLLLCEHDFHLRAEPIIHQLVQWEDARLPDSLPPVPEWLKFDWPASGEVDLENYWRAWDGGRVTR